MWNLEYVQKGMTLTLVDVTPCMDEEIMDQGSYTAFRALTSTESRLIETHNRYQLPSENCQINSAVRSCL